MRGGPELLPAPSLIAVKETTTLAEQVRSTYERLRSKNRKERRELQRRLFFDDPGLETRTPTLPELTSESHFVAAPPGLDRNLCGSSAPGRDGFAE